MDPIKKDLKMEDILRTLLPPVESDETPKGEKTWQQKVIDILEECGKLIGDPSQLNDFDDDSKLIEYIEAQSLNEELIGQISLQLLSDYLHDIISTQESDPDSTAVYDLSPLVSILNYQNKHGATLCELAIKSGYPMMA
jgi:hypothetical protein